MASISLADAIKIVGDRAGWDRILKHRAGTRLTVEAAHAAWGLKRDDDPNFVIVSDGTRLHIHKVDDDGVVGPRFIEDTGLTSNPKEV